MFYSGDKIVVERNKNNWQGNACNNDSGSSKVINNKDIECTDFNLLEAKLRSIMRKYDYTCLSVDIFLNDKGFGVLEFQEEFGWTNTSGIDSVKLNKYMVNSLIKKIEDYEKDKFIDIWISLKKYKENSDKLINNHDINLTKHDGYLYHVIIMLLKTHFIQEQVDLIIFSIYDENKIINDVVIDNAQTCWEYINKMVD